jgi:hypothetical protein
MSTSTLCLMLNNALQLVPYAYVLAISMNIALELVSYMYLSVYMFTVASAS